jgi:hypothetical protein
MSAGTNNATSMSEKVEGSSRTPAQIGKHTAVPLDAVCGSHNCNAQQLLGPQGTAGV